MATAAERLVMVEPLGSGSAVVGGGAAGQSLLKLDSFMYCCCQFIMHVLGMTLDFCIKSSFACFCVCVVVHDCFTFCFQLGVRIDLSRSDRIDEGCHSCGACRITSLISTTCL